MTRDAPVAPPSPTSREVMVRSLRRRLWKALLEEDVDTAVRAYTATRKDYLDWLAQERLADERKRQMEEKAREKALQERREARPAALRRLGSIVSSRKGGKEGTHHQHHHHQRRRQNRKSKESNRHSSDSMSDADPILTERDLSEKVLQVEFGSAGVFVPDDYKSPYDSYVVAEEEKTETKSTTTRLKPTPRRRERRGPRLAGLLFFKGSSGHDPWATMSEELKGEEDKTDETITTPLHEAARLGNPTLVKLILDAGGNPNLKNGRNRTALHMVAGGLSNGEAAALEALTTKEAQESAPNETEVGIRTPVVPLNESENKEDGRNAKHAFGRLFNNLSKELTPDDASDGTTKEAAHATEQDVVAWATQRMDTLLMILCWSHPQDGTSSAGEGPSLNAVDSRGRTALHYCAELGRADACLTILARFGTILTIVDESGQTPCELAARQTHASLAAQLEARALLYADPYGLDEELLATVYDNTEDNTGRDALVPPFSWFETWSKQRVSQSRTRRIETTLQQMKDFLLIEHEKKDSLSVIFGGGDEPAATNEAALSNTEATETTLCEEQQSNETQPQEESAASRDSNEDTEAAKISANDDAGQATEGVESTVDDVDDEGTKLESDNVEQGEKPGSDDVDQPTEEAASNNDDEPEIESGADDNPATPESQENEGQADERPIGPESADLDEPQPEDVEASPPAEPTTEFQACLQGIHEAHAERLLAEHDWDVQKSIATFRIDPLKWLQGSVRTQVRPTDEQTDQNVCLICCDYFEQGSSQWRELKGCNHGFCVECLGDYIGECARTGDTGVCINCPHHECSVPLSREEIEALAPTQDVHDSLIKAADETFVSKAKDMVFCPHPGCQGVVHCTRPPFAVSHQLDIDLIFFTGAVCTAVGENPKNDVCGTSVDARLTYEGVKDDNYSATRCSTQPLAAHRFCFACGGKPHWPVTCEVLDQWKEKIEEEVGEEESDGKGDNFNDVAQKLWLKANTRPCPKCKAPIEKNDGCNHMTCTNRNCRHEFCWICRQDWKLHNTETGGFFRCNRWQDDENHQFYAAPPPPEERNRDITAVEASPNDNHYGTALHSSQMAWKKSKEMGRFLHHYRRWTAHRESAELERNMAQSVSQRMVPVVEAAIEYNGSEQFDFGGKGLSFIHAAFTELLECRSLLQHSYAFAFFRYPASESRRYRSRAAKNKEREKLSFEHLQSELEMMTEQMSDIAARKHIRATQMQVIFLTKGACEKRSELSSFMMNVNRDMRKEAKEERNKKKDKKKSSSSSSREPESSSDFDPPGLYFPTHREDPNPRDDVPEYLRRLLDSSQYPPSRYRDLDSEDDDPSSLGGGGGGYGANRAWWQRAEQRAEEDAFQEAVNLSLQAMQRTTDNGFTSEQEPRWEDWACSACTYMNVGGRRCAICGSARA